MSQLVQINSSIPKISENQTFRKLSKNIDRKIILVVLAAIAFLGTYIGLTALFPQIMVPLTVGLALFSMPFLVSGACGEWCCPVSRINHAD